MRRISMLITGLAVMATPALAQDAFRERASAIITEAGCNPQLSRERVTAECRDRAQASALKERLRPIIGSSRVIFGPLCSYRPQTEEVLGCALQIEPRSS